MKATTIISQLQALIDKHGNHEVITTVTEKCDGVFIGDTIDIPEDTVLFNSGWVNDNDNLGEGLDVPFNLDIQQAIDDTHNQ